MGRHINDTTGAIVSVADEKDHRFAAGWKPLAPGEAAPAKKTPRKTAAKAVDDTPAAPAPGDDE